MNINLRLSTENDASLIERFVDAYHSFEGVSHPDQDTLGAIRALLGQSPFGRVWLICLGSQPIGYAVICFGYTIEFSGRDAFLDELFIIQEQRGKGIGKAVLALVKAEAAALGVKVLHLEVARTNERAKSLYRSAGFMPRERFFLMSAPLSSAGIQQGIQPDGPAEGGAAGQFEH